MIPWPMVAATAVPVSAPATFKVDAISTARPGESTRVATEVAIALAVSWNPLMKSKTNASPTIRRRTSNSGSGIFEEDPLQHVGNVLGPVGRVFEQLVELAPAQRVDEVRDRLHAIVEAGEYGVEGVVGLVFGPVQLEDGRPQRVGSAAGALQLRNGAGDGLGLLDQDAGEQAGGLGRCAEAVEPEPFASLFEIVDEVVERRRQVADVVAVEGGDEGAVADLVAVVLQVAQSPHRALGVRTVRDDLGEQPRRLQCIGGGFSEEAEELLVARQETGQDHRRIPLRTSPAARTGASILPPRWHASSSNGNASNASVILVRPPPYRVTRHGTPIRSDPATTSERLVQHSAPIDPVPRGTPDSACLCSSRL